MSAAARASIVITTKNRKEELRVALASAVTQSVPCEVIVIDDGSTDGTSDLVRQEFPQVRLHRSEVSRGLISQRNHGARLATTPIIFSTDDDAAYSTPNVIEQTLADFDDPRIGAVATPYVNVHVSPDLLQQPPDKADRYITDRYIGVSHAVRRDVFLTLGGYREQFIHQCEEGDYCLRMLNAGWVVRLGRADPVHHFDSPKRSRKRMVMFNARNHVLHSWQTIPFPLTPLFLLASSFRCLQHDRRHPLWVGEGLLRGCGLCLAGRAPRAPVRRDVFRLSRELRKRGPRPLSSIESMLPPQAVPTGS